MASSERAESSDGKDSIVKAARMLVEDCAFAEDDFVLEGRSVNDSYLARLYRAVKAESSDQEDAKPMRQEIADIAPDLPNVVDDVFASFDQEDTISDDLRTVRYAIPEGNRAADDALDRIEVAVVEVAPVEAHAIWLALACAELHFRTATRDGVTLILPDWYDDLRRLYQRAQAELAAVSDGE